MKIDIVTIFPEYFAPLDLSLIGRARQRGLLSITVHDLRTWTHDIHRTVDDTPYGGGPGMVMRPEPWGEALDALTNLRRPVDAASARPAGETPRPPRLIVPTPAGQPFTQAMAAAFASEHALLFACGRYEGIDQRVLDHATTQVPVSEVSLGDYVLFGGEVAVLAMVEAIARLVPGVLGNADSLVEESHTAGLLESPVYTKPPVWRGLPVPEILRSGDHGRIARWRRDQSLVRTVRSRPDLLSRLRSDALDRQDRECLRGAGFQLSPPDVAE